MLPSTIHKSYLHEMECPAKVKTKKSMKPLKPGPPRRATLTYHTLSNYLLLYIEIIEPTEKNTKFQIQPNEKRNDSGR